MECIRHTCTKDYDCYHYYPHTKCVNNDCVCDDVSRFCPINQACVYLPNSMNYMVAIFVMAGAFVVISVGSMYATFCWTKRKYQREQQNLLAQNSVGTNQRNYQTDGSFGVKN